MGLINSMCVHVCCFKELLRCYCRVVCFDLHLCTGRGLTLRLIRNTTQCGGLEELKPVDQNLQYDFNFQQFTILPNEVTVLPVS